MIGFTTREPNQPVRIYSGRFNIVGEVRAGDTEGAIVVRWLPQPKLLFESACLRLDSDWPILEGILFYGRSFQIVDAEKRFTLGDTNRWAITMPGASEGEPGGYLKVELARFEHAEDSDPDRVEFSVANFSGLRKGEVSGSGWSSINKVSLLAEGWLVELGHSPLGYDPRNESGAFALTHIGTLRRENGGTFSKIEALEVLEALRYFLSFIQGQWCWPCLYTGIVATEFCWFFCGEPPAIDQITERHFRGPFTTYEQITIRSFVGFLRLWKDPDWQLPLKTFLAWYVEANRSYSLESSIVAGQTALELISWIQVVERRKVLSPEGFDKLIAADRFRLFLNLLGIPVDFPASLSALRDYSSDPKRRWEDGPRAIAELRNSIVHPRKRENLYNASEPVREEAKRLTVWYLATAISRFFGYDGELTSA